MCKRNDRTLTWKLLAIWAALVGLCVAFGGCGGGSGLRFGPSEAQRQNRQAAAEIARAVERHGLPPASPAARVLARAAAEAAIEAGPPQQPVTVADLVPEADAQAWRTLRAQADALATKAGVLGRALPAQTERLAGLVERLRTATAPPAAESVAAELEAIAQAGQLAAAMAADVTVPDLPAVTQEEARRVAAAEQRLAAVADQAASDAALRPGAGDVEAAVLDEADFWLPLVGLIPGAAGVAELARRLVKARREYREEARTRTLLVQQNDALFNSPLGRTTVQVNGEAIPLADLAKATIFAGQDDQTRAAVAEAKRAVQAVRDA